MSQWPESWRSTALVGGAATLLNWPAWAPIVTGLDPSWQAGIALAFTRHMQWGPRLDFTYGPYGFAGFIEPFALSTSLIAFVYVFTVTWLLAALIVAGSRRYWGLATAGVIAWAVVGVSVAVAHAADFVSVAGFGLALTTFRTGHKAVRANLVRVLGALTGFSLLVKLNAGVILVGLLVLAVAGEDEPWRQRLSEAGQAVGVLVAVFAIAWAAAGQSFANLASFIHESVSLVLGYSAAMGGRLTPSSIAWWALAMGAVTVFVFAAAFYSWPRKHQLVGWLMLIGWGWGVTKDGFVSGNHFPGFFRIVLAATALACLARPPRFLYSGALAAAACITFAAAQLPPLNPLVSLSSFAREAADLVQPGRFAHLAASSRSSILKDEPLAPATLSLLRGHTLAIEPWEDMVAWADPQAPWDPEPVVQAYSAYTASLDQLDAAFMSSRRAPERILYWRFNFGFDFRDPFMEPPATMEAIYCHYTQLTFRPPWQVLQHVPNRCGPAETIGKVHARFGQTVSVPSAAGKMVVASFAFGLPLLSKLETVLLKPPDTYLTVWSGHDPPVTYRFVTGTAPDAHVLSVPAALGYAARFTPPTSVQKIELSGGGWGAGQGSLTVTFQAVSMAPR